MLLDNLFAQLGCLPTVAFLVGLLVVVALPAADALIAGPRRGAR